MKRKAKLKKRAVAVLALLLVAALVLTGAVVRLALKQLRNGDPGVPAVVIVPTGQTLPPITAPTQEDESQAANEGTTGPSAPTAPLPDLYSLPDTQYVRIRDYIPDIWIELKYATADNITGRPIYNFTEAWLRCGTVKKLAAAQAKLRQYGYSLKIWDAYRPMEAQEALWAVMPNPRYISNPAVGPRSHNLGGAVDLTLVMADGSPVEMPSGFDDFTDKGDRNYENVSLEAAAHMNLLDQALLSNGMEQYIHEWWHYDDIVKYTYDETFTVPR